MATLKETLGYLMSVGGYPCVSVLLPTHRTAPANQQDAILLKNLLTEAESRLLQEFSKREAEPVLRQLQHLADGVDVNHNLNGLALFATASMGVKVDLPLGVEPRVVVDDNFATRDLIKATNRQQAYLMLKFTAELAELYEGFEDTLVPVRGDGFPAKMFYASGGANPKDSGRRENELAEFFNRVDKQLFRFWNAQRRPIVLAGIDHHLATFRSVADRPGHIYHTLSGNFDHTSLHDLGQLAWSEVSSVLAQERAARVAEVAQAVSANKCRTGLAQAYNAAVQGQVELLMVEDDYFQPATLGSDGLSIKFTDDATAPGVIDDAVDETAEAVVRLGGRVIFAEPGSLAAYDRVAAILRY